MTQLPWHGIMFGSWAVRPPAGKCMQVFISHGFDAQDAEGHAALSWLAARLRAASSSIDPFYDRERLKPGYDWEQALHVWLEGCSAGVVFLSPRAIERDWVRKEATILAWRRACQGASAFQVHVVLWGEVSDDDLVRHGYGPLRMSAIQALRCPSSAPEALQPVVDQLSAHAARMHGQTAATPLDTLTRYLSARLGSVPQVLDLQPLALAITGSLPAWDPQQPHGSCAREVAQSVVQNRFGSLANLRGLMTQLHQVNLAPPARKEIFEVLAPLWVDSAAAAPLHAGEAVEGHRSTRFVALRVQDASLSAFEAEMLVRRANPLPDDARLVMVGPPKKADADPEVVCDWVAARLDAKLGPTLARRLQEDEGGSLEERIDALARMAYPVYLVLRFAIDLDQAEALAERLPGFTFVCLVTAAPDPLPDARWHKVSVPTSLDRLRERATEFDTIQSGFGF